MGIFAFVLVTIIALAFAFCGTLLVVLPVAALYRLRALIARISARANS